MNDIYHKKQSSKYSFEALYADIIKTEKRLYTNEQVLLLPEVSLPNNYIREWNIRKKSSLSLIAYLKKKQKPLNILEIGCGNGWLSARLAAIKNIKVIGLDINEIEIVQAKSIFKMSNLEFVCSCFPSEKLRDLKFDIIVFAAAFQYFPSVTNTINNCHDYLSATGEIHIIDTFFYTQEEIQQTEENPKSAFTNANCTTPNDYYHHSINDFEAFNYRIKSNPSSFWNRLFNKSPFYWVMINYTSPR